MHTINFLAPSARIYGHCIPPEAWYPSDTSHSVIRLKPNFWVTVRSHSADLESEIFLWSPLFVTLTVTGKICVLISSWRSRCFQVGILVTHFWNIIISIILPNYICLLRFWNQDLISVCLPKSFGWLAWLVSWHYTQRHPSHCVCVLRNLAYSLPLVIALIL